MTKKPYIIGGFCLLAGYFWCYLARPARPVSDELVAFHRKEQLGRLRHLLARGMRRNR